MCIVSYRLFTEQQVLQNKKCQFPIFKVIFVLKFIKHSAFIYSIATVRCRTRHKALKGAFIQTRLSAIVTPSSKSSFFNIFYTVTGQRWYSQMSKSKNSEEWIKQLSHLFLRYVFKCKNKFQRVSSSIYKRNRNQGDIQGVRAFSRFFKFYFQAIFYLEGYF